MELPLQISFRNMNSSEAVEASIRKWAAKLERAYDTIISCRVVVEAPPKHKRRGGYFHTRIDITLPGAELAVNREPDPHHSYTDVYVSIRDAFKNAQRQVEEYVKRRQGQVKTHETPSCGRIKALFPEEDYGRIEMPDGADIYFHRNSIINADFDKLEIGVEVRFVEQEGVEGPQASSVRVLGKHRVM